MCGVGLFLNTLIWGRRPNSTNSLRKSDPYETEICTTQIAHSLFLVWWAIERGCRRQCSTFSGAFRCRPRRALSLCMFWACVSEPFWILVNVNVLFHLYSKKCSLKLTFKCVMFTLTVWQLHWLTSQFLNLIYELIKRIKLKFNLWESNTFLHLFGMLHLHIDLRFIDRVVGRN